MRAPAIPTTTLMPPSEISASSACSFAPGTGSDDTLASSDLPECAPTGDATSEAMAHLTKVYIAGLLILGLFGNVYCVTAFLMPVFRRVPSTLYLAALAMSDIGFLMTLGLMWMRSIGLRFLDMPHVCTICMFMSYFCCFLSSWLVFAITMERYLLASGDRRSRGCSGGSWRCLLGSAGGGGGTQGGGRQMSASSKPRSANTHRRVRVTFLVIIVFGAIVNSWVLFTAESVPQQSLIHDDARSNPNGTSRRRVAHQAESPASSWGLDSPDAMLEPHLPHIGPRPTRAVSGNVRWGTTPRPVASSTPSNPNVPAIAICDVNQASAGHWYPLFNALDMIFSFTLPFLGVLILNAKIGFRVCKAQSLARRQDAEHQRRRGGDSSSGFNNAYEDSMIVLRRDSRLPESAIIREYLRQQQQHQLFDPDAAPSSTGGDEDMRLEARNDARRDAQLEMMDTDQLRAHLLYDARRASPSGLIVVNGGGGGGARRRNRREKTERRVTQLLVTVSLAYLILNLPSYVHRVVVAFEPTQSDDSNAPSNARTHLGIVAETVSYLMFYTQFSINFFLYSCHGCMFGFNC